MADPSYLPNGVIVDAKRAGINIEGSLLQTPKKKLRGTKRVLNKRELESPKPARKTYADVTAVHATPQSGREESEGDESDESSSGSSRSAGYSQAQVDTLIEDNSKRLELAHAAERNSRATAYEEKVDMLQNDMLF